MACLFPPSNNAKVLSHFMTTSSPLWEERLISSPKRRAPSKPSRDKWLSIWSFSRKISRDRSLSRRSNKSSQQPRRKLRRQRKTRPLSKKLMTMRPRRLSFKSCKRNSRRLKQRKQLNQKTKKRTPMMRMMIRRRILNKNQMLEMAGRPTSIFGISLWKR